MKRLSLIFLIVLIGFPALGQAPIRRQFFTTNDNPIVDVVAGSNATVQASTPAANIRRFTVNGVTDTNIVTAIAQAQTNGLATTNFVLGSQVWTNDGQFIYPPNISSEGVVIMGDYATNGSPYSAQLTTIALNSTNAGLTSLAYLWNSSGANPQGNLHISAGGNTIFDAFVDRTLANTSIALLTNGVDVFRVSKDGQITFSGNSVATAGTYYGNGAGLTNLPGGSQVWTNDAGVIHPVSSNAFQIWPRGQIAQGSDLTNIWGNLDKADTFISYRNRDLEDVSRSKFYFGLVSNATYSAWSEIDYDLTIPVGYPTFNWLATAGTAASYEQFVLNGQAPDLTGNNSSAYLLWKLDGSAYGTKNYVALYPWGTAPLGSHYYFNTPTNAVTNLLVIANNAINKFVVAADGTIYGNGAGLTNLPSGGTGSSNITDSAYYAVARNLTVNTNADINNLTVTNLTVDSGSGIGVIELENSGTNIIALNGTNGYVTAVKFIGDGSLLTGITNGMNVAPGTNIVVTTNGSLATVSLTTNPIVSSLTAYGSGTNIFGASQFTNGLYIIGTATNFFGASYFTNGIYGDGSGLTNLPSGGTGSSNITDSGYVAVARNLTVSTNLIVVNSNYSKTLGFGTNGSYFAESAAGPKIYINSGKLDFGAGGYVQNGTVATWYGGQIGIGDGFPGTLKQYLDGAGITSHGTNVVYSLHTDGANYERYLFEPEDTRLTIRADTAGSGDDNLSIRVVPVGSGSFYLDNASATVGNTRGSGSVDLQMARNSATQVSSGAYSFAFGVSNTASGTCSSGAGVSAKAVLQAQHSHSAGAFSADGDSQYSRLVARATGASNTATNCLLAGTSGVLALPANTSWSFYIQITARSTDAGTGDEESAAYEIKGLIERDNTASNCRLVGSPIVTTIAEDDALWDVSATADTTNGALQINVVGNNETAVRWVATVHLTEVGG